MTVSQDLDSALENVFERTFQTMRFLRMCKLSLTLSLFIFEVEPFSSEKRENYVPTDVHKTHKFRENEEKN